MRKIISTLVCLAITSVAFAGLINLRKGFGHGAQVAPVNCSTIPLTCPLVQSSDAILTFLGSFKAPTTFFYGGGAMSTNGTTMYLSGLMFYPTGCTPGSTCNYVPGVGSMTLPTLSGAPATDGSNGTATPGVAPRTLTDGSGNPILNCGQAAASTYCLPTGSMVYGGNLYTTWGPYYDSANSANSWIVQSDTSLSNASFKIPNYSTSSNGPGSCGAANSVGSGTYTRYFAAPLGLVPTAWQPYLGGPAYIAGGTGGLSVNLNSTMGFAFSTFDPATYNNGGGSIAVSQDMQYCGQGLIRDPLNEQLNWRSLNGPYPLAGGGGASYTLTGAPSAGTTTVRLTTTFTVPNTCGSLTCSSGPFQIKFSDGETSTVHLINGCAYVPASQAGNTCGASFTASYGETGVTTFPALTCGGGCSTAVTINLLGDNYLSEYDGPPGYCFIVPGSKSYLCVNIHSYGPAGAATTGCDNGASGTNDAPISPDTAHYRRLQITAFDLTDLYHAKNGVESDTNCPAQSPGNTQVYAICPYAWWEFPGASSFYNGSHCLLAGGVGYFYFDPNTNILYGTFSTNYWGGGGYSIVNEWSVSGT